MTTLYVAMEGEVLTLTDQGGGWRTGTHLAGLSPQSLAVDQKQPTRLYCGTSGQGLYVSEDAGSSWRPVGHGIDHDDVTALASGPGEGVLYAGTEPSAVYRSEDTGQSWQELTGLADLPSASEWSFPPRPHTHHVRAIAVDPAHPELIYVCIEAGALVRSPDAGVSWEDRRPDGPRDTHELSVHPGAPGRLYSAAGDGYFESFDYGHSWQRLVEGLSHRYLWSVAVDAEDPETMVASAAHGPRQAHVSGSAESALYRRTGGGDWQQCRQGLPEPEGTLASLVATGEEPGMFYVASNRGLYRSGGAGQSWERLQIEWPERYQSQHPRALAVVG